MNKASGGDGIPVELFQILKVLHSIYQQIWKTQKWPQDWKTSVFIPIPKKSNAKECSNYSTIALISTLAEKEMATHSSVLAWRIPGTGEPRGLRSMGSHRAEHDWSDLAVTATLAKLCSKFSKPGFNSMRTENTQMFKLDVEKAEEPEIKLPTSAGSSKEKESSRKTSISALLTMPKLLTVWITTNCGKFWERWEYQTTWPASWEICMQVKKQQLGLDMEQQTGSK